ncbi:MAG: transposase, partial [Candidatus Thiodiazotropha sp.]
GQKTKKQIADQYGLASSTLSTWVKKADEIKNAYHNGDYSAKRKRLRTAGYPEVEEALLKWFKSARDQNVPITGPFMMEKATGLAERLGVPEGQFKVSSGWLERFKERHGISFKRVCGEEKSVDMHSDQMEEWKRTLSVILKEYQPDDIYNADETGLFFRLMPDKTLEFKNVDCHGGKQSKERITALVCANMSGTDKVPLFVLGKSANPRCFKNVKSLPTQYDANPKAWMTSAIFTKWVTKFDKKCQRQQRRVALIVDNCPAHPKIKGLKAVNLIFLPPNTTSRTQPMDQGVIRSLKHHYRKQVIMKHLRAIDRKEQVKINVLDALYFLQQAWRSVTQQTIANCYGHAGFKINDDVSQTESTANDDDEDPLDDLPLARLIGNNITIDEYVSVDDNVPVCDVLTEDSIVDDIIAARPTSAACDGDGDDDDDEQADEAPVEPPSSDMALSACDTLRHFLQGQPGVDDILGKLCDIDRCVSRIDLSRRCAKQALITDFFRV